MYNSEGGAEYGFLEFRRMLYVQLTCQLFYSSTLQYQREM